MREFKEGDKIRILSDCSGAKEGQIYTLRYLLVKESKILYASNQRRMTEVTHDCGCSCLNNWKLIEKNKVIREYPIVAFMRGDLIKSL